MYVCIYISISKYMYIYAQSLGFAQVLQRRGSPFPIKSCFNSAFHLGRSTKVSGNIKNHTPVKLYIQLGRSTKVVGNIKVPPPLNFTFIEDLR